MNVIELGGNAYEIGRIDAMRQLHVSRRVLPVLIAAGIGVAQLVQDPGKTVDDSWLMLVADGAMAVVARMSDEDVDYVVQHCLAVVKRRPVGSDLPWAPVMNGKMFQFQDMDMRVIVQVVVATLRENVGSFFPQQPDNESTLTGS